MVKEHNISFMFDLNFLKHSSPDHPYWYKFVDIVVQTIKDSGVDLKQVKFFLDFSWLMFLRLVIAILEDKTIWNF